MAQGVVLSPEVRAALAEGRPVVALESSVVAHGLPRPHNLEAARHMDAAVRAAGAVPAVVAVVRGQARVGLEGEELAELAARRGVPKISSHNLAYHLAAADWGATTVAATLLLARAAGIRVLATGGVGGVHREPEGDVSADLPILAATPMVVVASGAKAILDLPRTLEWLETHGVVVLGYRTGELPAFYVRSSGLALDLRVEAAAEVAEVLRRQLTLGLPAGVLVAQPVPEEAAVPAAELEARLQPLLREARARGLRGGQITPFLLSRLARTGGGRMLQANLALLEANARLGGEIAAALGGSPAC